MLLSDRFGLIAVFLTLPAVSFLGTLLMIGLPTARGVRARAPGPVSIGRIGLRPVIALLALFAFFCGQNAIVASTLAVGSAAGLSARTAGTVLAVAVVVGLLGERFGVRSPILAATVALAFVSLGVALTPNLLIFGLGIFWIQLTTLFIVPYFFTLLRGWISPDAPRRSDRPSC